VDLGRLSDALSPELIAEVLRDPRTYRTEATLLLAIVVVLVLFIVVALIEVDVWRRGRCGRSSHCRARRGERKCV